MKLIKLDAIDSTNTFLKNLAVNVELDDFTVVSAKHQLSGKGQMGSEWVSEADKNLMFSVYKRFERLTIENQFCISMIVSLSIHEVLSALKLSKIKIKWPNDILSCDKKVGGVLIENKLKDKQIESSIIGIGLNVNQTVFRNLNQASSLYVNYKRKFDRDNLLKQIVNRLEINFKKYDFSSSDSINELHSNYEKLLFNLNLLKPYSLQDETIFDGVIKGVTETGELKIEVNGVNETFNIKEIRFLY
ncbi:MAG: biotin--[acetyl-CoA-carboxylase] ligase [Flavobacteriaceae bacterium]